MKFIFMAAILAALGVGSTHVSTAKANIPGDNGTGMCEYRYSHNAPFWAPCR